MKAICRKGHTIDVPCNWNVQGRCGDDSFPCGLVSFEAMDHQHVDPHTDNRA